METFFAPAEKASEDMLLAGIEAVKNNPAFDTLMNLSNGAFAILNMERQILALNKEYLNAIGIRDPQKVLGLRPGEAIQCVHSFDTPGGCGTSKYCATCGAAIALVSSQELDHPVEKCCFLSIKHNNSTVDRFFNVSAQTYYSNDKKYILLYIQDITQQQNSAAIEKLFLHDMGNIVGGLLGVSELLEPGGNGEQAELIGDVKSLSLRLAREISIQRSLLQSNLSTFTPHYSQVVPSEILKNMETLFANHKVSERKTLSTWHCGCDTPITTDFHLLSRVVENMVKNAFEATAAGSEVRISYLCGDKSTTFEVWNREYITERKALRIFQRNYSTKEGLGHGLGTYCMKLFGEKILGGTVGFTTSETAGTTFHITLPKR